MYVSDLIYMAYRIAGIMPNAGTTENPEELADGFATLNAMVDQWTIQRLMTYTIIPYVFNFVAGQQSYQIGLGAADWKIPRPPRIELASCLINEGGSPTVEQPMAPLTYQNWQTIPVKGTQSPIPYSFYYDQAFPIAHCYFYPVPSNSANQVALYIWEQLGTFSSTAQSVMFPPGYLKAIQYNLALDLADRFAERAKLSPRAMREAKMALDWIKSMNMPILDMKCDRAVVPGEGGIYNYLSDSWKYS
jgi:hypothetical protein